MSTFTDIKKRVLSHVAYGEDTRPARDWSILLVLVFSLLVVSALWNAWMYVQVVRGESVGDAGAPPSVDTHAIDAVQDVFQKRAIEASQYKTNYHFVDPSK